MRYVAWLIAIVCLTLATLQAGPAKAERRAAEERKKVEDDGLVPNRGVPRREIHTIILHTVSGPLCRGGRVVYSGAPGDAARWKRFFDNHPFLSIHYVVDRAGTVLKSTPESREANHALHNNRGTIGIELVHNGDGVEPFGARQIEALIELIRLIRTRHAIPIANIKSHAAVDTRTFVCGGRAVKNRQDPGANFPWARLRGALEEEEEEQPY